MKVSFEMSVKRYSNSGFWIYGKNHQPHDNCTLLQKSVFLVAICLDKLGWNAFLFKRCSFLNAKLTLEAVFISLISVSICWETEVPTSPFLRNSSLEYLPITGVYCSPISVFFKLQFFPLCPVKHRKLGHFIVWMCFTEIFIAWSWKQHNARAEPRMKTLPSEDTAPKFFFHRFVNAWLLWDTPLPSPSIFWYQWLVLTKFLTSEYLNII